MGGHSAVNGTTLRLRLNLANGSPAATGVLVSLNQNNVAMPISTITQKKAPETDPSTKSRARSTAS